MTFSVIALNASAFQLMRQSNASKIALAALVAFCRAKGLPLIDCQQDTEHIRKFGATLIEGADYLAHLRRERDRVVAWAPLG